MEAKSRFKVKLSNEAQEFLDGLPNKVPGRYYISKSESKRKCCRGNRGIEKEIIKRCILTFYSRYANLFKE